PAVYPAAAATARRCAPPASGLASRRRTADNWRRNSCRAPFFLAQLLPSEYLFSTFRWGRGRRAEREGQSNTSRSQFPVYSDFPCEESLCGPRRVSREWHIICKRRKSRSGVGLVMNTDSGAL